MTKPIKNNEIINVIAQTQILTLINDYIKYGLKRRKLAKPRVLWADQGTPSVKPKVHE